jgi:hypothetical protein
VEHIMNRFRPQVLAASILSLALILSPRAAADGAFLSTTGTFDIVSGANLDELFTAPAGSNLTLRTYAANGGTNAAGVVIPAGGIDSILDLYTSVGALVDHNDDLGGGSHDSLITRALGAGDYFVRMTNFSTDIGDGHFALDVTNATGPLTFNALSRNFTSVRTAYFAGTGSAVATLNLSGTLNISESLIASTNGRLRINPGANFTTASERISTAVFAAGEANAVQTGGTHTVSGNLTLGGYGTSSFSQSGGTTTVGGTLLIGGSLTASATYTLAPTATLNASSEQILRNGFFTQTGGSHVVTASLDIGETAGAGTFDLAGGTLSALVMNINSNGFFQMDLSGAVSGGTIFNHGSFLVTGNSSLASALVLYDDSSTQLFATLLASNAITLKNARIKGGTGEINLSGPASLNGFGTVDAPVYSAGTIRASGGNLTLDAATLTNDGGTLTNDPGANLFVNATTLTNNGNVTVNSGGSVVFTGHALTNPFGKTITLKGGTLSAAAPGITNAAGGAVNGFGNVSANFTNNGAATFNGPTNIIGNLTNNGGATITVRNDQTLVTGITANDGTITSTSGGKIVFDGGIVLAPPFPGAPKAAPALSGGGVDGAGNITINAGSQVITSYVRQSTVTLSGTEANPAFLMMRKKADGGDTSVVKTLTMTGGIKIDLADNRLIVDYTGASPIASVRAAILAGYNPAGPHWQGNGIVSSLAAANPTGLAIGYGEAATILSPTGGTFGGQTADGTAVLVRMTVPGDATLDGIVNFADLVKLAQNYNVVDGSRLWSEGDFTYDGNTNFADLVQLAQNYNTSLPGGSFEADLQLAFAAVPEPSMTLTLTLSLSLCACARVARRRGRLSDPTTNTFPARSVVIARRSAELCPCSSTSSVFTHRHSPVGATFAT